MAESIHFNRDIPFVKNGIDKNAKIWIDAERKKNGNWFIMFIGDYLKSEDYYEIPNHDVMEKIVNIHNEAVANIKAYGDTR
jgi:hypothetical protein